jgi:flavodoxin
MDRTLIVYSTKYGSTRRLADKLARILGPAAAVTPAEFCPQHGRTNPSYWDRLCTAGRFCLK